MGHKWNTSRTWGIRQFLVFDYRRLVTIRAHINVPVRHKIWEKLKEFRSIPKITVWCSYIKWRYKKTGRKDIILLINLKVEERYIKSSQIWQFKRPIDKIKVKGLRKCITCTIIIASNDLHGLALITAIDKVR